MKHSKHSSFYLLCIILVLDDSEFCERHMNGTDFVDIKAFLTQTILDATVKIV